MRYYPVFLDLAGQLCIVLGDGKFAVEKAAALREAGANVRAISARDYRSGALAGARLVVDASEDEEVNRLSWQEAEAAGILINVVDRPAQCRFIAPAIVRRDPLLVAISTSGESPFLASMLRARIERWLGWEWGPFVELVGEVRGLGGMCAIELVRNPGSKEPADTETKEVAKYCYEHGLITITP